MNRATDTAAELTLESSIHEARNALHRHNQYLSGNETATRILVIDVVLGGLGWDVRKPEHVRLEHRVNGHRIDYLLLSGEVKQPLAIVEAKAADVGSKSKDVRDASGYASEVGARYAILTNGGRWEAWNRTTETPRKENMLVEVNLTTGDVAEIAEALRSLHRDVIGHEVQNIPAQ